MAQLEDVLHGNIYEWMTKIQHELLRTSTSASLEGSSDFVSGDIKCCVRVFERYSFIGSNRLSLSITMLQIGNEPIHISAISAGGSCGVVLKLNTWGETSFLEDLKKILYSPA